MQQTYLTFLDVFLPPQGAQATWQSTLGYEVTIDMTHAAPANESYATLVDARRQQELRERKKRQREQAAEEPMSIPQSKRGFSASEDGLAASFNNLTVSGAECEEDERISEEELVQDRHAQEIATRVPAALIFSVRFAATKVASRSLGEPIVLDDTEASTTIVQVKQMMNDKEGVSPEKQNFILPGQDLVDGTTLSDCKLTAPSDEKLHLVLRREAGGVATVSLNIRHYLTNILTRIVENPTTNKYFRLNISGERAIHSSIWHDDDYRWLLVAVGFATSDTQPDTHVKAPVNPRTVQKAKSALKVLKASAPR